MASSGVRDTISPQRAGSDTGRAGADLRIAVLAPCKDEEITIGGVVAAFRAALPGASIWVCDNGSRDGTALCAAESGANVVDEERPGKGNAVRRLFACVDADVYVLVDGDGTYAAASAPELVRQLVERRLDMIVGKRVTNAANVAAAYRTVHRFGNQAFAWLMRRLFGVNVTDPFSGYRVLSRRFVRSFPLLSRGFEIETELTVHALELGMTIREIPTPYSERPEGSASKLNTLRDGARITVTLLHLYEQVKPLAFFSVVAIALAVVSLALGVPVVIEFIETGLVPRFPTAILASAVMLAAFLSAVCGAILDSVARGRREAKRLSFLAAG